jgi:hypothetical protein
MLIACNKKQDVSTPFVFNKNEAGIELWEDNSLVFFYQLKPKSLNGEYSRNNYIHPLMSLDGDTLTEDFPADHLHQRGVFWAWHQIYVDTQHVSDSWSLINFISDVNTVNTTTTNTQAKIDLELLWKSPAYHSGEPYVEENTQITVNHITKGMRKIDFKISLLALIPGVQIGGSDDEKGYGGFSLRIKMPEGLIFTSNSGQIIPRNLQIKAGPWLDFSAPYGENGEMSGITLIGYPGLPNFSQRWILRQQNSMQNIVFPGRDTVELSKNDPLVLNYSLIIHRNRAEENPDLRILLEEKI